MIKKIFAFDLDGTYIADSKDNKVLPSAVKAVKLIKQKGHIPVIATGRPLADVLKKVKGAKFFDYIVCNNGAYVYNNKKATYEFIEEVNKDVVKKLIEISKKHKNLIAIHTEKFSTRYRVSSKVEDYEIKIVNEEWKKFGELLHIDEVNDNFINDNKITQISLRSNNQIIKEVFKKFSLHSDKASIAVSSDVYLDVNPLGANKFTGLKKLSQNLNIAIKDIIAFGDSNNDLEMLKYVGHGVCMGNGSEEAKNHADKIIGTNKTDALLNYVNHLFDK